VESFGLAIFSSVTRGRSSLLDTTHSVKVINACINLHGLKISALVGVQFPQKTIVNQHHSTRNRVDLACTVYGVTNALKKLRERF
jgi:hypothetical protein